MSLTELTAEVPQQIALQQLIDDAKEMKNSMMDKINWQDDKPAPTLAR